MRITMIGTGYVGLVTGACFSEFGYDVTCVDSNADKIKALRKGETPIFEPGLDDLVAHNSKAGRLHFETELAGPAGTANAVFIAVGTPSKRGGGDADLSHVFSAVEELAPALKGYTVVVTKSTVPVGTGRQVHKILSEGAPEADFDVASNPEFLREGSAINDFQRPDRVVVGAESSRSKDLMRELYRPLFLNETPVLMTGLETAELIKYASNAFLATKITFINQIADLCEAVGADVQEVARGMGLDGRIGQKFLHAGPGYGGSCFPKDTRALMHQGQAAGTPVSIIEAVVSVNEGRKKRMTEKTIAAFGNSLKDKTIAVLGLTFKPNTDDMREAPSLLIVPTLQKAGANIQAYDPEGMKEAREMMVGVKWCADAYEAMDNADGVLILTEWNEFRSLDISRVKKLLNSLIMVDLRNIYEPKEMQDSGFTYISVGRAAVGPIVA